MGVRAGGRADAPLRPDGVHVLNATGQAVRAVIVPGPDGRRDLLLIPLNGAEVSGPIPLPTKKEIVTILRAVHKYKDSREQFEMRTHKRLIDIHRPSQKCVDALMNLQLPAGVEIELKL